MKATPVSLTAAAMASSEALSPSRSACARRIASAIWELISLIDRDGVIVAWNKIINSVRVAVGIGDCDDRDIQFLRLTDGNGLLARINHEDHTRQIPHVFDSADIALQFDPLFFHEQDFFFGKAIDRPICLHGFDGLQPVYAAFDRLKIGQHTTKPTMIDIEHPAPLGFFTDDGLGLTLGSDKQNIPAFFHFLRNKGTGLVEKALWSSQD